MQNLKLKLIMPLLVCLIVTDGALAAPEQILKEIPDAKVVTGQAGQKSETLVFELDDPGITTAYFELRGDVKYEGVEGSGYLEMWSIFPDGGRYFTRSVAPSGPMQGLSGTSEARAFVLPFRSKAGHFPKRVTLGVILPGAGTVSVSNMSLVQADRPGLVGGWWSSSGGGWIGGAFGILLGIFGAVVGVLGSRERTRPAAVVVAALATVSCVTVLLGGVVALVMGQPYHVWYPLLLCGLIGTVVMPVSIWVIRRRSAEEELRRIAAMDAPG